MKKTMLEEHQSVWLSDSSIPEFPELKENLETDILIIGGGIAGLSTAYFLNQSGKKIIVIDSSQIGGNESTYTTAHLTWVLDENFKRLLQLKGKEDGRAVLLSHQKAIDTIQEIIQKEEISCDFKRLDGYLFLAPEDQMSHLQEELEALREFGMSDVELAEGLPIDLLKLRPALRFPNQARFHPVKYLRNLVHLLKNRGVSFYSRTHAERVQNNQIVTKTGFTIGAQKIVVATNSPVKNILFFIKQSAHRTYVIAGKVPHGSVPDGLYWDTQQTNGNNDYHYIRLQEVNRENDLLIIGGGDHKTGQDDDIDRPLEIEKWARKYFPMMTEVEYRWSGQIIEPTDSIAFIGKSPFHPGVYLATGFSGNGYTYGTIAGLLLRDLILNQENPWTDLYDPRRKKSYIVKDFMTENLNVVKRYFSDYFKKEKVTSVEKILPAQGAIVGSGIKKLAVYRDAEGMYHVFSPVCPHLGCIVQWNHEEGTFDCPCHGSRFSARNGHVLNGPAIKDLKEKF